MVNHKVQEDEKNCNYCVDLDIVFPAHLFYQSRLLYESQIERLGNYVWIQLETIIEYCNLCIAFRFAYLGLGNDSLDTHLSKTPNQSNEKRTCQSGTQRRTITFFCNVVVVGLNFNSTLKEVKVEFEKVKSIDIFIISIRQT